MSLFTFEQKHCLGIVRSVDTRKVNVQVNSNEDLRKARVGQLIAIALPGALSEWLIGIIGKVTKMPILNDSSTEADETEGDADTEVRESILNTVRATLVGAVLQDGDKHRFMRSILQVPEIDAKCYIMQDVQLQMFMGLLSSDDRAEDSLDIGRYTLDNDAVAYLDGNKLFQRHAALLGSTGSGKSWAVASILEHAQKLPSSNLIVFDLHGEYSMLSYAKQLRIPGPDEIGKSDVSLLYLPYWLLNTEELQAMFIDRSEFSAHNQVMMFQDTVINMKKKTLLDHKRDDILKAFTLDSPIPFDIKKVLEELSRINSEMVTGSTGKDKQGPFYGQFDRLLLRLQSKISDKRYGFLFQSPDDANKYDAMGIMMNTLMNYVGDKAKIKVINFSEVPADILPVIVGLVARIVFQIQFWTDREKRKPIAFVCDEAHLYLPNKDGKNPLEQRAIENFEKIAKEGRKYGVALFIVSQRPSDVSSTILSQCNNVISLRLTNGDDQTTVKHLMPESFVELLDVLPIIDIGEALVVGDAVLLPCRIKLTPPNEAPISATINIWDEWKKDPVSPDLAKSVENMRKQSRI